MGCQKPSFRKAAAGFRHKAEPDAAEAGRFSDGDGHFCRFGPCPQYYSRAQQARMIPERREPPAPVAAALDECRTDMARGMFT